MPGRLHELIVELVAQMPQTVPRLLLDAGHMRKPLPTVALARRISLGQPDPSELRPDLVLELDGPRGKQVLIVEVQRGCDANKRRVF